MLFDFIECSHQVQQFTFRVHVGKAQVDKTGIWRQAKLLICRQPIYRCRVGAAKTRMGQTAYPATQLFIGIQLRWLPRISQHNIALLH